MESLKKLEEICQPDVRQSYFSILDPQHPGGLRKVTLQDFYQSTESIQLHKGVPEEIRSHFETARNLLLYSWFYYPFTVTAQLCAYTSAEYALKVKSNNFSAKPSFRRLLKTAVENKWISDEGFSHVKSARENLRAYNQQRPPDFQTPMPAFAEEYCKILVETLPYLRNELVHGSSMLHPNGAMDVRICADLINQLFPEPRAD